MKRALWAWLSILLALPVMPLHAETVTIGGAVVTIAAGWKQKADGGAVVMTPADLPVGVGCTFTLLGGETFDGSLKERLNTEWKEFEKLGPMVSDDGGKISGAGSALVGASRAGRVKIKEGVNVDVWLTIVSTKGRIERMVFVATTPEAFAKYGPGVVEMINGIKYVVPKKVAEVVKDGAKDAGTFGKMSYGVPAGWVEKRAENEIVLLPADPPRNELLEIVVMPAKGFTGTLEAALEQSWDEAAELSQLSKTRTVNGKAYTAQEKRTSFKGWEYIRAEGVITSAPGANDYIFNLTVIKINDRIERILVRSKQNRLGGVRRYTLYDAPKYRQATQEFIFGVRFSDWKEPKLEPGTLKGDGIVGVWNGSAMFGTKLSVAYAIFFSNGQVFLSNRFPFRGCYEFNTLVDAELVPQFWGRYEFKDGKGTVKIGNREIPMRSKREELLFTSQNADQRFLRMPSMDGAKFEGNYAFNGFNGKVPSIRLTADGNFEDRGALFLLRLEIEYPFSATTEPGGGTYVVNDYTLLLEYKDGRKYRIAFPGPWSYDKKVFSPDVLRVGYGDQELKKL